ncbi:MAG: heparinase [Lentisphaerae bacterium]|jgi:oligo-alginate lyase|nr:heparinase [Lentisphaerota bacterium]MBT4816165.1 heparinase [Lentisphaerota bacterium]MBT7056839.1 heparinase [Lentisphaerota bacterium]MBT7845375.1 heparinase [Lentisphaerota bacterium]
MATPNLADSAPRASGGLHTPERLANIRRNVERFPWAKAAARRSVHHAKRWVSMSDEELWQLVPGQKLPRCIDVTMTYTRKGKARPGCLVCGEKVFKHGNYPYSPNVFAKPWKLTCPSCKAVFPTNDFAAFYQSAIGKDGCFDAGNGDTALLFNAEHPDANDPLHTWGVDNGHGYIDENGLGHRYIAYYTWKLWQTILNGVGALSNASSHTGDRLYAHKCAILLDRIADVYPDMDWNEYARRGWYHSDGGSKKGKIEGRIWETGVLRKLATSYDRIIPGLAPQDELYAFLAGKGEAFDLPTGKGTHAELMQNIDDRILRCGADAIRAQRIWGNEGMHQASMAACAIALDTQPDTNTMIDWIFAEDGGHVPTVIVGGIDRDGVGAEAGPGYALSWGGNIGAVADLLARYGKYTTHDIYRDYPQFAKTFAAGTRLTILGYDTPSIGDAGATGTIGKVQCSPDFIIRGYRFLGDADIALAAFRENGFSAKGLGLSITDPDPKKTETDITAIAKTADEGTTGLGPHNMAGYGLLTLETGHAKQGAGVFMYYGRNKGHGHQDRLNIGIYGFGFDLTPDLGYPEFATSWPKRNEWTRQTIAHNTVVVDESSQTTNWVGHPTFFKALPGLQCAEVESSDIYPSTRDYRRTVLFVPLTEQTGYVVDIFRVEGGDDHLRSFHGPGTEVTAEGLSLTAQATGTYAGADTPFGSSVTRGKRIGFSWLAEVERDAAPPSEWSIDWRLQAGYRGATKADNIHLRLWDVSGVDDVALANGEPPQNKSGNPRWIRYCLARRKGRNLTSTFVSVVEPYRDAPAIVAVERLGIPGKPAHGGPVALQIRLADGSQHTVLYSPDGQPFTAQDNTAFEGRVGLVVTGSSGSIQQATLVAGKSLSRGDVELTCDQPTWQGMVAAREQLPNGHSVIRTAAKLPLNGTLVGSEIIVENDRVRNACYTICGVRAVDGLTEIDLGRVSLVRNFVDPKDYTKGFTYNFEPGSPFTIPNHACLEAR